jgi:hypothetical protein
LYITDHAEVKQVSVLMVAPIRRHINENNGGRPISAPEAEVQPCPQQEDTYTHAGDMGIDADNFRVKDSCPWIGA